MWNMFATSDQPDTPKMSYWLNVLIAIDQLGNAIAGGNPDNTISGRVGFFASDLHQSKIKAYWKALERIIDFTFAPLQGPGHCLHAWEGEQDETDTEATYIARILLSVFVVAGCFLIGIVLWSAILIHPAWRYKAGELEYASWRQARKTSVKKSIVAVPVTSSTAASTS
jgi:hypothetical protein